MKILLFLIFFSCIIFRLNGQTKKELENQRQKALEEINYIDNILRETSKSKNISSNELKIVGSKLYKRENIISGLLEEIDLLNNKIELNNIAIEMMEEDLIILKNDYSKTIVNSYKARKGNPELGFLLSANDFNQGYKRLKYLQEVSRFRKKESEIINDLKEEIEKTKKRLQKDLISISDLKEKEERQRNMLQMEHEKKRKLINYLGNKEKQLKKELDEKKRVALKIESEIAKIIEEEKKRNITSELTPEQKLIGESFIENRGKLPWPVEKGILTGQFGLHKHPILNYVTEDNPGIEITSSGKTMVRSIFKGQVVKVFAISGANAAVIIRHGKYLTVYLNIINVKVKTGDYVETKQEIGEVFCDEEDAQKSILKFMIYEEKEKINPELWLAKK